MFGTADSDLQDRLSSALAAVMALRTELASNPDLNARWLAVKQFQAGRVEYRMDKNGNLSVPFGKLSFDVKQLEENVSIAAHFELQPAVKQQLLETGKIT